MTFMVCNLTTIKLFASSCFAGANTEFKKQLGQFAGKHQDEHDSEGGVTCMLTMSDLVDTDEPGYFLHGELGIAIRMLLFLLPTSLNLMYMYIGQQNLVAACFQGVRFHGGYPPTALPGTEPDPASYRFVIVCYPPRAILDGKARVSFGALPTGNQFLMPPEMIRPL